RKEHRVAAIPIGISRQPKYASKTQQGLLKQRLQHKIFINRKGAHKAPFLFLHGYAADYIFFGLNFLAGFVLKLLLLLGLISDAPNIVIAQRKPMSAVDSSCCMKRLVAGFNHKA